MIFSNTFFEKLSGNKFEIGVEICSKILEFDTGKTDKDKWDSYEDYIEALAVLISFDEKYEMHLNIPSITQDKHESIREIIKCCHINKSYMEGKISEDILENAKGKYRGLFEVGFVYKLTDGDLARVQELINQLRDHITNSELFTANHKERLLKKLESLQKELHKKMSNLDKFWGLIGDAGVVLGKFGNDAQPFVNMVKEIAEIIWRTQAAAEELPSGFTIPMLDTSIKKKENEN